MTLDHIISYHHVTPPSPTSLQPLYQCTISQHNTTRPNTTQHMTACLSRPKQHRTLTTDESEHSASRNCSSASTHATLIMPALFSSHEGSPNFPTVSIQHTTHNTQHISHKSKSPKNKLHYSKHFLPHSLTPSLTHPAPRSKPSRLPAEQPPPLSRRPCVLRTAGDSAEALDMHTASQCQLTPLEIESHSSVSE